MPSRKCQSPSFHGLTSLGIDGVREMRAVCPTAVIAVRGLRGIRHYHALVSGSPHSRSFPRALLLLLEKSGTLFGIHNAADGNVVAAIVSRRVCDREKWISTSVKLLLEKLDLSHLSFIKMIFRAPAFYRYGDMLNMCDLPQLRSSDDNEDSRRNKGSSQ
jgi:hypothetical protein